MSFTESVRTCLSKYVTFSGRARRSEFWWFQLFYGLCIVALAIIDNIVNNGFPVLLTFLLVPPSWAVSVRRLHDTGRSGWLMFISIVPFVGGLVLFIFQCLDSQPFTNMYGPSPKEEGPYPGPYTDPQIA
jgi:uncharacterized membrane protein YhaH (DUF805 family)